jgi:ribosomal protein S18 acetylase RimI-like enzyme
MLRIRIMVPDDLPSAISLTGHARWNQTPADWRRLLDLEPSGCFVAELNGQVVGTTTTCIFGPVAWVAMVLVDPQFRRQGIGAALMQHALHFLHERKVPTIRLDATPQGQPLYEKLGFVPEYLLNRYDGAAKGARPIIPLENALPEQWDVLIRLDQEVTGTQRRKFLVRLFAEAPEAIRVARSGQNIRGFVTARPGTNAVQIGPCIAEPDAGAALIADAFHRHAGRRVFVDVPLQNQAAVTLAEESGLTVQRQLMRMCRGPPIPEKVDQLWASSGPEKG